MRSILSVGCCLLIAAAGLRTSAVERPVPKLQVLPLPHDQASFVRGDTEIARCHFAPTQRRPFIFPVVGPSGRSLTRMGHPRDPQGHSHHNSVWISHEKVNGVSFWGDRGKGRIAHRSIENFEDLGESSWITVVNGWVDEGAKDKVLILERRRTTVRLLDGDQWMLILDLQLESPSPNEKVTLGETAFGLIGVRMAKTIGVHDGGGQIRSSAGATGEEAIFRKPAKWVDYSGPIRENVVEGITLMDHPSNPGHPSPFHVRADGWMGICLTHTGERVIEPAKPLRLRYGLFVHAAKPPADVLEKRWGDFAKEELPDLNPPKRK
jgi:hypothetical protein